MTRSFGSILPSPVQVWRLPLVPLTFDQVLDTVDELIMKREPSLIITANLNYAMLTSVDSRLERVNQNAALILADGSPLVWAARRSGVHFPGRIAGSDLLPALCERAARQGHRVFFLGGPPGLMAEAASLLQSRLPDLQVVGAESFPYGPCTPEEQAALTLRIQDAKPDLLFMALPQPIGEIWLDAHLSELHVPVCFQVGAAFDMLTGRVRRAPSWIQRRGLEWAWRIANEPRRLGPRYFRNALFLARQLMRFRHHSRGQ